jgi:indole-3-glycerol phosphate synthase
MTILDQIIAHKKKEVEQSKKEVPVSELQKGPFFKNETLSLKRYLLDESKTGIIAEFKRRSPSKGIINDTATVEAVTTAYAENGASGISILTDAEFFGGSIKDLLAATINELPLLRKDFMIDEYQLIEAKAYGAEVILLIAACLSPKEVKQLAGIAKSLGMEVLLELHDETELDHICDDVDLVGINNRNLKTFEVSIQTSLDLVQKIPSSKVAVTESGIADVETIVSLKRAGFKGFLIGENFMKHPNPAIAFAEFVHELKAKNEN